MIRNRRANMLATLIIVIVLIGSVSALLIINPPLRTVQVDYGRATSEAMILQEQLFRLALGQHAANGLVGEEGLWYCNQPLAPTGEQVAESFEPVVAGEHVLERDDITITVTSSGQELIWDPDTHEFRVSPASLRVNTTTREEDRVYTVDTEEENASQLTEVFETLETWMSCDAGGLQERLTNTLKDGQCAWEFCCCGDQDLEALAENAASGDTITEADMEALLEETLAELQGVFATGSCGAPQEDGPCRIVDFSDTLLAENYGYWRIKPGDCPTGGCGMAPMGIPGTIRNLNAPEPLDLTSCPDDRETFGYPSFGPDPGTFSSDEEPTDNTIISYHYQYILERRAGADFAIACGGVDPVIVRIRFAAKHVCSPPAMPDIPGATCPTGGGGNPCDEPDEVGLHCVPPMSSSIPPELSGSCVDGICLESGGVYTCEYVDGESSVAPDGTPCGACFVCQSGACEFNGNVLCPGYTVGIGMCATENPEGGARCEQSPDEIAAQTGEEDCLGIAMCTPGGACLREPLPNEVCGGGCKLCDDTGYCTRNEDAWVSCERQDGCIDLYCDGMGDCTFETPNDGYCNGVAGCTGACDGDTGFCDFSGSDGDACSPPGNCPGTCDDGACTIPSTETRECCDFSVGGRDWCPPEAPTCCGVDFCTDDPELCGSAD